jgi:CheY-like chemotaxis protein
VKEILQHQAEMRRDLSAKIGLFGQIALRLGLLTAEQLDDCTQLQAQDGTLRLGEVCVEQGYLRPEQVKMILKHQALVLRGEALPGLRNVAQAERPAPLSTSAPAPASAAAPALAPVPSATTPPPVFATAPVSAPPRTPPPPAFAAAPVPAPARSTPPPAFAAAPVSAPPRPPPPPVVTAKPIPDPAAGSRCVLIADDQPDLLAILSSRFTAQGFRVLEARNGAQALELALSHRPPVVVLDVMMPELNGFQVCRRLREARDLPRILIVLLTAKDTEADRFWGKEVGADIYLTKPVDPATVVQKVHDLLERG